MRKSQPHSRLGCVADSVQFQRMSHDLNTSQSQDLCRPFVCTVIPRMELCPAHDPCKALFSGGGMCVLLSEPIGSHLGKRMINVISMCLWGEGYRGIPRMVPSAVPATLEGLPCLMPGDKLPKVRRSPSPHIPLHLSRLSEMAHWFHLTHDCVHKTQSRVYGARVGSFLHWHS
jgi:hypothetical protein